MSREGSRKTLWRRSWGRLTSRCSGRGTNRRAAELVRRTHLVLQSPTYVVLELPAAVATQIHVLRERYDPRTARLPMEITVAGSSGVGALSPDQDAQHVF